MAKTPHSERFTVQVPLASTSFDLRDRLGDQSFYFLTNLDGAAVVTVDPWNGTAIAYGDDMFNIPPGATRRIRTTQSGKISAISTVANSRLEIASGSISTGDQY